MALRKDLTLKDEIFTSTSGTVPSVQLPWNWYNRRNHWGVGARVIHVLFRPLSSEAKPQRSLQRDWHRPEMIGLATATSLVLGRCGPHVGKRGMNCYLDESTPKWWRWRTVFDAVRNERERTFERWTTWWCTGTRPRKISHIPTAKIIPHVS